jgi:leucyl aminopeptidase
MFNLKIIAGEKKITYKPLSLAVKYVIDEKRLNESVKNIQKIFNIKFSSLQIKSFLSKEGTVLRASKPDGKPDELLLVKVKIDEKFSPDFFRNQLAGLIQELSSGEVKHLHIFIPKFEPFKSHFKTTDYFQQTFVEGVIVGNYSFSKYRSDKKAGKNLSSYFYTEGGKGLKNAVNTAKNLMQGVNLAKDLSNEPGDVLTPEEFASQAAKILIKSGVKVKIFTEKEIKKMKMGGLLAVGSGSDYPPRLLFAEYKGNPAAYKTKYCIVGKGVTFDSGGISIKPAADMWEMKADMAGAAAVAGAMLSIAKNRLPINIICVIPLAENMPSGKSMKPGDIIITSSGKSIEVDNTDAEGRIILADALHFASNKKPVEIIDLATLTGACVVALGEFAAGLFTKNEKLAKLLTETGNAVHERVWAMPMWDDYHELNKSDVADVKNIGGRWGGAISAAKFLENFVDKKITWAHLDIAGPALPHTYNNYTKKYMTGFGVRLLFEYFKDKS